eukprot:COSAG02_NODE_9291_length_2264_cov_19.465127_1_plen_26_part_10
MHAIDHLHGLLVSFVVGWAFIYFFLI